MIRILWRRAVAKIFCSRSRPAGPISLNPAERIMIPLTLAIAHCSIIFGTVGAGVAIIAKSISSAIAVIS